jgi:hypothetical protein
VARGLGGDGCEELVMRFPVMVRVEVTGPLGDIPNHWS